MVLLRGRCVPVSRKEEKEEERVTGVRLFTSLLGLR